MNKTVAIVVTYNRKDILKNNIESLLNQKGAECDILVVNNASTDGTEEMVLRDYNMDQVIYCNTGANLGGAGGFEYGVGKAAELGYEYIWIMDDDTWPEEDALAKLFEADKELEGNWGYLSSVAYWTDGSICRMNIQKKDIFRHIGKKEYEQNISKIQMCSFVSLLVKGDIVRELGCPIGDYFIWTDDYEFTGRISRKYPCYMVSSSKVVHAMKTHTRVNFANDSADRIERYKYIYRNDVHCYRQYGFMGWMYLISKNMFTTLNVLLKSKDNRFKKIGVIWRGFASGIKYNPTIKKI